MGKAPQAKPNPLVTRAISRSSHPIVINSFGRSGSTMLHDAVARSALRWGLDPEGRWGRELYAKAWKLEKTKLLPGVVYKSHDYPPTLSPGSPELRVIYIFGSPIKATVSVMKKAQDMPPQWFPKHCRHLGVERCEPDDLPTRDALHIRDHYRSWLQQNSHPTLFVRFEKIWEHLGEVEDFLGFPVELPAREERTSGSFADDATMEQITKTYEAFERELDDAPDIHRVVAAGSGRVRPRWIR